MRLPRVQFTVRRMMTIVAGVALTLWLYDSSSVAICDGRYFLAVRVDSVSRTPIGAVTCESLGREEYAAETSERLLPPESPSCSASADPFIGQVLSVRVPFTSHVSPLGRWVDDFQFRRLVIIVTYRDGRRLGKVVVIPHRDVTQSISVAFP